MINVAERQVVVSRRVNRLIFYSYHFSVKMKHCVEFSQIMLINEREMKTIKQKRGGYIKAKVFSNEAH